MEQQKTVFSQGIWDASSYQQQHHYVFQKGLDVVDFLAAQPNERILDLGCGTGQLTAQIAKQAKAVTGVDRSESMIEAAIRNYPNVQFECKDGTQLDYKNEFDAVFSNAALHWMKEDPQAVFNGVYAALKPGGRFVFEMGAKGNVQKVTEGITYGLLSIGQTAEQVQSKNPWYFPSLGEAASCLESAGFEIAYATTFDRPTPQEKHGEGIVSWLRMFGTSFYQDVPAEKLDKALRAAEVYLKPLLYREQDEQWVADYRRLRVIAIKRVVQ